MAERKNKHFAAVYHCPLARVLKSYNMTSLLRHCYGTHNHIKQPDSASKTWPPMGWLEWSSCHWTHLCVLLFNGSRTFTLPLPLISAYKDKQHQSLYLPCKNLISISYCIAQNFRGRKHSWTLQFWSHPWKFSPWNLGVPYPPMIDFNSIPQRRGAYDII